MPEAPYQVNFSGVQPSNVAPTQATTTDVGLPAYSAPYIQQLYKNTADVISQPYQQYQGQTTAGVNPLMMQGIGTLQQMQPSGYLNQAAGLAGMGATNQFTGSNVGQYMSPYMQNVVNQQQAGAIRDYSRQLPGMSAAASQMGGLGGTRNALVQAEGQRNLQNTLAGIQATGLQNAFQNAQSQFNQQNQNLMQGANMLNNIGQTQYGQQAGIVNAQLGAGSGLRDIEQQGLTNAYNQYMNAYNFPMQQLKFASDIYRGFPGSSTTTTGYGQGPSPLASMSAFYGGLGNMFGNSTQSK
jgi:hypothetical protein